VPEPDVPVPPYVPDAPVAPPLVPYEPEVLPDVPLRPLEVPDVPYDPLPDVEPRFDDDEPFMSSFLFLSHPLIAMAPSASEAAAAMLTSFRMIDPFQ